MLALLQWITSAVTIMAAQALDTGQCSSALGMKTGHIPDEFITASSYFDHAVNAIYARAHVELGGGAWCPRAPVYRDTKEFLEVSLGTLHTVTAVEVQGRFGNGQGKEYAEQFKLQYWRPGLKHWVTYSDPHGKQILEGNSNTYLAKKSSLAPPIVASGIRFLPYSHVHPRTVCMRVEIYGCAYTQGLISYSMGDGDPRGSDDGLRDVTYDGLRLDGQLYEGLGQLVDGETGHTNFRVDAIGRDRGYEWIGWKNDTRKGQPVEIIFQFNAIRNFSSLHLYANNFFTRDTQVFSRARVSFSISGNKYKSHPVINFTHVPDRIFETARNVTIKLPNTPAKFVKLELFFALRWIMISEVVFDSVLCECNFTEKEISPVVIKKEGKEAEAKIQTSVLPANDSPSGLLLGGLVTLGIVFGIVPVTLGILYYRTRLARKTLSKSDPSSCAGETSMMKDLSMNLSSFSNGFSRTREKIYDYEVTDDESAMYSEPLKGPLHQSGYYTLGPETSLKFAPAIDTDDSVDYAIPDMNITPPPPSFSDMHSPPPPIPLSRPPGTFKNSVRTIPRDTATPTLPPPVPPLPEEKFYMTTNLCQISNIQGATGSVIYAVADIASLGKKKKVPEVPRHSLHLIDTLGEGLFGVIQLCEIVDKNCKKRVIVKSLQPDVSEDTVADFHQESKLLSSLDDPNIIQLVGIVNELDSPAMILEHMEHGDLNQFLKRHVTDDEYRNSSCSSIESSSSKSIISYGALVYIASQVASGMKYLETKKIVHRDLATRNCMVGRRINIKISDFGMSRPLYSSDYYKIGDTHTLLPIRWMAWESILHGRFSTKSDVWSFGVTLWEILTLGRQQPYEELDNDGILENISCCYHGDGTNMEYLPIPKLCPREMYDMMTACWRTNERQRPPFWEIHMFLQRKKLGYVLDYRD